MDFTAPYANYQYKEEKNLGIYMLKYYLIGYTHQINCRHDCSDHVLSVIIFGN